MKSIKKIDVALIAAVIAVFVWAIWVSTQIDGTAAALEETGEAPEARQKETDKLYAIFEEYTKTYGELQPPSEFEPDPDMPLSSELQLHVHNLCRQNDIEPGIVFAIIEHESRYQVDAVGYNRNGTYDSGLCQINSVNHGWLDAHYGLDVSDPYDNIEAAVVILRRFMDKYPLETALAAYAAGEHGAVELGRGKWFAEEILCDT